MSAAAAAGGAGRPAPINYTAIHLVNLTDQLEKTAGWKDVGIISQDGKQYKVQILVYQKDANGTIIPVVEKDVNRVDIETLESIQALTSEALANIGTGRSIVLSEEGRRITAKTDDRQTDIKRPSPALLSAFNQVRLAFGPGRSAVETPAASAAAVAPSRPSRLYTIGGSQNLTDLFQTAIPRKTAPADHERRHASRRGAAADNAAETRKRGPGAARASSRPPQHGRGGGGAARAERKDEESSDERDGDSGAAHG